MKGFALPKLNRNQYKRQALLRQLTTFLFEHEQIRTTVARAQMVQRIAERCISMAKRGSVEGKLKLYHFINKPSVVQKVIRDVACRYSTRPGGYTRVLRYGPRPHDQAPMALIELVGHSHDLKRALAKLPISCSKTA
jgi:large subunit ribosomal protein L17